MINSLAIYVIRVYQIFSKGFLQQSAGFLAFPTSCKFQPSCSEYAVESYKRYNFFKASGKSAMRILKCNPWAKPKVDLP
jgi:putative membrane protein insertion efficiency factor